MIKIIITASVIYGFYCMAVFFMLLPILFPVSHIPEPPPPEFKNTPVEIQWIDLGDFQVETWYLSPLSNSAAAPYPVIIFAHGNAERIDDALYEMFPFTRLGIGVLLVEYPGYGRSTGRPSQSSITKSMIAAYDKITQRPDIDPSKVILFGRSLGGGAVCQLAAQRMSAALILVSTFTSIRSFASSYLIPGFLVRDPFDNLSVVRKYQGPILLFHGTHDEIIPYHHGLALSRNAKNATMITYVCGHNDLPPSREPYIKSIIDFLKQHRIISGAF